MQTVVAAVIIQDGRVFCAKRPMDKILGGLWEFPGGKVEPGESFEEALIREIEEELGIVITVDRPLLRVIHEYPSHVVHLHSYLCHWVGGDITLHVHTDAKWVTPKELKELEWVAGDDPIIEFLQKNEALL